MIWNFNFMRLLLISSIFYIQEVLSACDLPWPGDWIENGRDVNITQNYIENLGKCKERRKDEYLLVSPTGTRGDCYRCLIAFPVHQNALQYKSTQCIFDQSMTVDRCRNYFNGDTPLHTMFRKDASRIPCPLKVPLSFTYHDSSGTCSSRTSNIHRCSQWDRLSIHYQACPENPTRESTVSELECIAVWESIGQKFFAARVSSKRGVDYRCFIQQSSGSSGRLGISADSGCQELTHIGAAATTLHYKQEAGIYVECAFPNYLWKHEYKRYKHGWDSMVTGTEHSVYKGLWTSKYNGQNHTVWQCLQHNHDGSIHTYRTHVRKGCQVGYQCVRVERKRKHMISIKYGAISLNEFEDCSEMRVEQRDVLILKNEKEICKHHGRHFSPFCPMSALSIGCEGEYVELLRDCQTHETYTYDCAAHYSENDQSFTAIRNRDTNQLHCMTHVYSPISLIRIYDHVACEYDAVNGALPSTIINITSSEQCDTSLLAGFLYSSSSFSATLSLVIIASCLFSM